MFIELSQIARREGILALEGKVQDIAKIWLKVNRNLITFSTCAVGSTFKRFQSPKDSQTRASHPIVHQRGLFARFWGAGCPK